MASKIWTIVRALAVLGLARAKRPNILFVLTDDQDLHMDSLEYMPLLQKYLVNEGTTYDRHYCTVAVCCPSRVNIWTGKTAHTVRKHPESGTVVTDQRRPT